MIQKKICQSEKLKLSYIKTSYKVIYKILKIIAFAFLPKKHYKLKFI